MPDLNSRGETLLGRGLAYLTDDTIVGQTELGGVWRVSSRPASGGNWSPLSDRGANMVAARNGHWLAFLAGYGLFGSGIYQPTMALAGDMQAARGVMGHDGTIGVLLDYQAGQGLRLWRADGSVLDIPNARPQAAGVCIVDRDLALWVDRGTGQIETLGLPRPQTVPGQIYWPSAFVLNGEWWLCYHSVDQLGVVLHPFSDASQGYKIALPPAFYVTAAAVDGKAVVAWSTTPDDMGGRSVVIDPSSPRVPLTFVAQPPPPPDVPPEPRSTMQRSGMVSDVLEYIVGDPSLWPRDGSHQMDLWVYPERRCFQYQKFGVGAYETWTLDGKHWVDASHTEYFFTNGPWFKPRNWTIGEWLNASDNTKVAYGEGCAIKSRVHFPYKTKIEGYYPRYWCGPDLGEREVITLIYDNTRGVTTDPGLHWERYYFAKGAGWFKWEYRRATDGGEDAMTQFYYVYGPRKPFSQRCHPLPPVVNIPTPPEPDVIPSLLSLVDEVATRGGQDRASQLNEIAWRANGNKPGGPWGVSYMSGGVPQPRTGKKIDPSSLHYSTNPTLSREDGRVGTLVKVFDGFTPVWEIAEQHGDPDRNWLPPVEPIIAIPERTIEQRVTALETRVAALENR